MAFSLKNRNTSLLPCDEKSLNHKRTCGQTDGRTETPHHYLASGC